jgi:fumarate hydratase class I
VTVAVDSTGESVHATGPLVWRENIAKMRALESA